MIFTDEKGKKWQVMASSPWFKNRWYLTDQGLRQAQSDGVDGTKLYLQVRPVPLEHEFGGVVFEETGETRPVREGEWFLSRDGRPLLWEVAGLDSLTPRSILRPVRVERPQDKA